jgi:hypothetical protein
MLFVLEEPVGRASDAREAVRDARGKGVFAWLLAMTPGGVR